MKPADLGRLDLEDAFKVVGTVAPSMWTQDMLIKYVGLPANIIKADAPPPARYVERLH